jgi:rhodanese-related sulfurtransferase
MTPHRLGPMLRAMTVARRAADMVAEARATIEELTVDELAGELASPNVVLVDLRETDELAVAGSIPRAVHVPRGTLEFQADPASRYHNPALRPERRVILLCATGARSALAAATLARMGYHDVAHLDGGIDAWIESGRPTRRDEDVRQSNQTPPQGGPNDEDTTVCNSRPEANQLRQRDVDGGVRDGVRRRHGLRLTSGRQK